ncbi:MAG: hypothetical protein LUD79_05210 [Oscillospiraceae bacterium]|nr:hypothetical protein [Oscillospiraceae bacterium]
MAPVRAATARFAAEVERLAAAKAPCRVQELNIKGRDLIALGVPPGRGLGAALDALLEAVMAGRCPNQREALLDYWTQIQSAE